jgi:hypothetical protein
MLKKAFCRLIITCVVLSLFCGSTCYAVDDRFGSARRIEGKHFTVYYSPEVELSALIQQLNVGPSEELLAGASTQKEFSMEAELADMLDTLFSQVCNALDMQLYSFKGEIKICRDPVHLNYIYHQIFNNEPAVTTRSFYSYINNTIYTSADNFIIGIIGHEMAHAVISHYFVVLPSVKIQEVLSAYVEYQLRNSGH